MPTAASRLALALVPLALVSGCARRTYNTTAIYEAPVGGYQVVATARGSFSVDYDLNPVPTGQARITPLAGGKNPPVTLTFPGNNTVHYTVEGSPPVVLPWMSLDSVPSLRAILTRAGYANLPDDETELMAQAIEGVCYGPKGTLIPGDPTPIPIRIVSVTLH